MEKNYATIWESLADAVPDRDALVHGDVRRTWRQFEDRAARIAAALREAGLGRGSRVGQLLYNSTEFVESYFAAIKIRAVPFNVNYRYVESEIEYILADADAEALIVHADLRDRVESILPRLPRLRVVIEVGGGGGSRGVIRDYEQVVAAHQPAARITRDGSDVTMSYTGGTTGMPKGVVMQMGAAIDELLATTPAMIGETPVDSVEQLLARVTDDDAASAGLAVIPASPLIHNAAVGVAMNPALLFGGRVVLLANRSFDPAELWTAVDAESVVAVVIVGDAFARPMLRALGAGEYRASTLRVIVSTGAMFSANVKAGLLERLPDVTTVDVISATEGSMGVAVSVADAQMPTGSFLPYPGVVVLDADDRVVEPGSGGTGRIALPCTDREYCRDEAKSAETFRHIGGVRYSIPGDYARVEENGVLTLLGRGSSCINTAGEKVYPEEVEETVKAFGPVEDCLVFGVPDERHGQRVAAVFSTVPEAGAVGPDELIEYSRTRLAGYKIPRAVVHVDEVPRTPTGKPDYTEAKRIFAARRR